VTIDISKLIRNRFELIDEFDKVYEMMPISYRNEPFYINPIKYPLTYVSDVLLHVPYAEAFGLILAEALLSGCAVVTTNAGGIREVVKHSQNAIVLDNYDMKISDAIQGLLKIEKPLVYNDNFARQFSLKNQFDNIIGDKDE
jgi:glycosyltransferase involved in cell wall biosynthesis